MNAHPMITPLTAMSPETVALSYPPDAAALYRLLWDSTLAHLKGPSTWRRIRMVFGDQALPVAMDWDVQDTPVGLMGYAAPPSGAVQALEQCTYFLVAEEAANKNCNVDALLGWADELQIASPGRLATLLEGLNKAGSLSLDDGGVTVTMGGIAQLDRAKAAGYGRLSGRTLARWRVACDDYVGSSAPLESLATQAERLLGVSVVDVVSQLETLVTHGHAVEDAYALRNQEAARPPVIAGYPRTMDPELNLRADDPLRLQRAHLEQALTNGREQQWVFLPADERVSIRLGFLASTLADEALATLVNDVCFDVRVRWLVGLSLNGIAPDLKRAKKAFNAWEYQK
ncbi:MAG: hypothetical protein ACREVW_00205 [Burkholderiales bacterium]